MSSLQLYKFSHTSPKAIRLGLSIFIFHFFGGSARGIKLVLAMKAIELAVIMLEVVQPCIVWPLKATLECGKVFGLRIA